MTRLNNIIIVIGVTVLVALFSRTESQTQIVNTHKTYQLSAYVSGNDEFTDYATENVWERQTKLPVYTDVILVMSDNGTPNMYDDEILAVKER